MSNGEVICEKKMIIKPVKKTPIRKSYPQPTIKNILVGFPQPTSLKSPYYSLQKEYDVNISFISFTRVEPIDMSDIRKQKIQIKDFTAIIFTSKNAVDCFFKIKNELKWEIFKDVKYFCTSESVALYLNKFTLCRKRKMFFGNDRSIDKLEAALTKHKTEKFFFPCSVEYQDKDIINVLNKNQSSFNISLLYRVLSNDISHIFKTDSFDLICFFTPLSVKSFAENLSKIDLKKYKIIVYGLNTYKMAQSYDLNIDCFAPQPEYNSMIDAIKYLLHHE